MNRIIGPPATPVTWDQIGSSLAKDVKAALEKRDGRINALEARLARLESAIEQRNFAYMGVWKEGKIYGPGSFVTYSGAIWHCNQPNTAARPGNGDCRWTLACKGQG